MTDQLFDKMPGSLNEIDDAKAAWEALAKLVTDDSKPVVTLKPGDELIQGLELLTTLTAATVVDDPDGSKVVTLLLETAPEAPAPKVGVKEAAAAQSSFAGERREENRRE